MYRLYFILILTINFCSNSIFAQGSNDLNNRVEEIAKKYMDSLGIVGMSVSVIHNDDIKFKKSFGYANLELDVPMTNSSVYRIWSVSKQFCAVSILKLETTDKLELSDPISKYLDSIPGTWKDITIEQLLNHTGGIKDYLNDFKEGQKLHSTSFEIVKDSTRVLKFSSGNDWSYTNTGYWILTKIIESVSGQKYQDYLQNEYFTPLNMKNTQKMDYFNIIKNRVNGYRNVKGVMKNSTRYLDENHLADGDAELISNNEDLSIWTKALFSGEIIELDLLEKAWNYSKYNNGDKIDASSIIYYDEYASYGMGWFISELAGQKIIWTPGAGRGFSTSIFSVPSSDLNIIVLCNARRFLIADKIAKDIATEIVNRN
ncbi:serine hydrolase domain-containing protein [Eudoraea sp.]|uniref:serine hydrolase domain-containing protein n=1 Tax=Eudoraea sp. TaxID=1979955 RepID=UPI003C722996